MFFLISKITIVSIIFSGKIFNKIHNKSNSTPKNVVILVITLNPDYNRKCSSFQHDFWTRICLLNLNRLYNSTFILLISCTVMLKEHAFFLEVLYCGLLIRPTPAKCARKHSIWAVCYFVCKSDSDTKITFLILVIEIRGSEDLTPIFEVQVSHLYKW